MKEINGIILDNNLFNIPDNITRIRFDIGLSYCGPNSAIWLTENTSNDLFVFGVEPNTDCLNQLKANGLHHNSHHRIMLPHKNYMLIETAIDNVNEIVEQQFYQMNGDPGTSSLLEPTSLLPYSVKDIVNVKTLPFSMLLDLIPWDRFSVIELVKIDTQGKDLDILKSIGKYINKIAYLNVEINTFKHYKNNPQPHEVEEYITSIGFKKVLNNSTVDGEVVDATYVNPIYENLNINYGVL